MKVICESCGGEGHHGYEQDSGNPFTCYACGGTGEVDDGEIYDPLLDVLSDPDADESDIDAAFASPGSALRAASWRNPRNLPCPTCGVENRLTPADAARGYQCDRCADRAERGMDY